MYEEEILTKDTESEPCDKEPLKPLKSQPTIPFKVVKTVPLGERLSRMASLSCIAPNTIVNDKDIRDLFISAGYKLPMNSTDIMNIICTQYEQVKAANVTLIKNLKSQNVKFSIDMDEYTSIQGLVDS